jgi:hypothetical protein
MEPAIPFPTASPTKKNKLPSTRDISECTSQPLVRVAGPNLGRRQAKRVHVHHRIGRGDLLLGHLPDIETRPDFAVFLVGEPNENVAQLERFFTAKIARIEAPASEDAGKPMAGKVSPFQLVE